MASIAHIGKICGIESYTTKAGFPQTGTIGTIYIDQSTSAMWVWDGSEYVLANRDSISSALMFEIDDVVLNGGKIVGTATNVLIDDEWNALTDEV